MNSFPPGVVALVTGAFLGCLAFSIVLVLIREVRAQHDRIQRGVAARYSSTSGAPMSTQGSTCRTLYSNGCCDECDECAPATCRVIGCEAAVADGATTCSRCQEELDGEYVSLWAIIRGGIAHRK